MSHGISRRAAGKLLMALPAVALAAPASADEKPTELADFLAAREPGLSAEERERLRKSVTELEKALRVVRDFRLPRDVALSLRFRPLRSRRR